MIDPYQAESLIESALIADSYSLGLHWIYDHDVLDRQTLGPDQLHAPLSHWHSTKRAGDLSHYGDQLWHLYQYVQRHGAFDVDQYRNAWVAFMEHYHGYVDKASAATLDNIRHGITPSGSASTELAVTSRIACPLWYTRSGEDYLEQVDALTRLTHDSDLAVSTCRFFARVLLDCLQGMSIARSVDRRLELLPDKLRLKARQGIVSAEEDTRTVLRQFGIACDIRYGLPGVMHLVHRYREVAPMLRANAVAGGDSSARGMISMMLMVAEQPDRLKQVPDHWLATVLERQHAK